jgi:hypothetical protein
LVDISGDPSMAPNVAGQRELLDLSSCWAVDLETRSV